jgi:hypothetical protein
LTDRAQEFDVERVRVLVDCDHLGDDERAELM